MSGCFLPSVRSALPSPGGKSAPPRVVAFQVKQVGQVVHADQRVGMLLAQRALARLQRPAVKRLRPGVVAFARKASWPGCSRCSACRDAPCPACARAPPAPGGKAAPPRRSRLCCKASRPGCSRCSACRDAPCPACARAPPAPGGKAAPPRRSRLCRQASWPGCSRCSACRDAPCPACARCASSARRYKRLRPGVVAFAPQQAGQVVHAAQRVGMLLAQRALAAPPAPAGTSGSAPA